ncbi:Hypothetical predicted protein, partial [Olea europaea subsp. europaea]
MRRVESMRTHCRQLQLEAKHDLNGTEETTVSVVISRDSSWGKDVTCFRVPTRPSVLAFGSGLYPSSLLYILDSEGGQYERIIAIHKRIKSTVITRTIVQMPTNSMEDMKETSSNNVHRPRPSLHGSHKLTIAQQ